MTDTATSEPEQAEAPQPVAPDAKGTEAIAEQPAGDEPAADDDRDAPDLSLKTPGLSDKNNNLKVELERMPMPPIKASSTLPALRLRNWACHKRC